MRPPSLPAPLSLPSRGGGVFFSDYRLRKRFGGVDQHFGHVEQRAAYGMVVGFRNNANGHSANVGGGSLNTASSYGTSVSGGYNHSVEGDYDWAAGALFQDQ